MEKETHTSQIKIKATPSDKKRWKDALDKDGRTMSEIFRAAMNRFAARVEKQGKDT